MKLDHVVRPGREHSNGVRRREEDRLAVPGGSIEPLDASDFSRSFGGFAIKTA